MDCCGPHATGHHRPATFEEAFGLARDWAVEPPPERVAVERCAGRTLARDVTVAREHPAVDCSAMDGFACRSDDLPGGLHVVGESRAGEPYPGTLSPGQATTISTGAPMPAGADTVLRVEDVEVAGRSVLAPARSRGRDVRRAGEDLRAGAALLGEGTRIRPQAIVALITAGHATVCCRRRPRVAILTSGDELVPAGHEAGPHRLPDGNGPGIAAQAAAAGAVIVDREHVVDDLAETERRIARALDPPEGDPPDVLLTVGGVSVGRHDHMRAALSAVGVAPLIDRVAIRPGHPVWLGHRGRQRVLALPGNPVAASLCFHAFGRPLLGVEDDWRRTAPLGRGVRAAASHTRLVPCRSDDGALLPIENTGSGDVGVLATADAIALIPPAPQPLAAGARVGHARFG